MNSSGCVVTLLAGLVLFAVIAAQEQERSGGPPVRGDPATGMPRGDGNSGLGDGPVCESGPQTLPSGGELRNPYDNAADHARRSAAEDDWTAAVRRELTDHYARTGPGAQAWNSGEGSLPTIGAIIANHQAAYQNWQHAVRTYGPADQRTVSTFEAYGLWDRRLTRARELAFELVR